MASVLAKRDCPLRIIQPHPVSLVKPPWLPSCFNRVANDMPLVAAGSLDFGIGGKLLRYVSHILVSTSSRKGPGQPLERASSRSADSVRSTISMLLLSGSFSFVEVAESIAEGTEDDSEEVLGGPVAWGPLWAGWTGCESYRWPRHQMGSELSFTGNGSQKYWTKRLPYFVISFVFMMLSLFAGRCYKEGERKAAGQATGGDAE